MLRTVKHIARDVNNAYTKLTADDGNHMAASVSFFMAISFFPLLLVLISSLGVVLRHTGWGQDAQQRLLNVIAARTAPAVADQVGAVLAGVQTDAVVGGPIGLLTLFFSAVIVFAVLDDAMGRIWNVPRPSDGGMIRMVRRVLWDRLRAFLLLIGVGVFAIAAFALNMSLSVIGALARDEWRMPGWIWHPLTLALGIALSWVMFALLYKVLPRVHVPWRDAAGGALFAAILWELGRRLLAAVVIGTRFSVYGVVGAFIAIMMWVFYATLVLFLGAEYIQTRTAGRAAERQH